MIEAPCVVLESKQLATIFTWPIRVYVEHTDYTGYVYHGEYVKFFEQARSEWLATLGFSLPELAEAGIVFVIRRLNIDYLQPAKVFDSLEVSTAIEQVTRVSLWFKQEIYSRTNHDKVFCRATVQAVTLGSTGRPCPIPKQLLERMQHA